MREQLKLLEDLQKIDLQLQETEKSLTALPSKLQATKDDIDRFETMLDADRQRLAETQRYKEELEEAIAHDRELLHKAKSKMAQVRNSKEYMAIQREFETNRKLTGEREEEITKLEQALAETRGSVEEREAKLAELREHVEAEEAETQKKMASIEEEAGAQRKQRAGMAEAIQNSLLSKYDRIRRLRGGVAVVQAERGVCTGCRMQLPPQLYNILQRCNSIEQCPTCQRIVFFEPPKKDDEEAASA